jgi:hypothetical protein
MMTHTFFQKNDNFIVESNTDIDQFIVEIAFAPDDTQLDLLFDTEMEGYDEMIENLESGFWQHMICRVQAKYDGKVMGESYLGSIVAESPEKWLAEDEANDDRSHPINDMIDEAVDQARNEAVRMLEILKADFLN